MNDEEQPHPFQVPLPPGFPPPPGFVPPPPGEDVVFLWHAAPAEAGQEREAEDLMLRRVPAQTAKRFRQAAGGRNLTHAQYLAALVALHDRMRTLADEGGDERVRAELERLGLSTVSV
jgi:hypothetical protein